MPPRRSILVFLAALFAVMGIWRTASAKSSGNSIGEPQRLEVPGQGDGF
jgi:hypothetical protein